jgi:hypothetical protein
MALLAVAVSNLIAQTKVQFAQVIKIDKSMTQQVTAQLDPDRWT